MARIVLVDDDEPIRKTLARALSESGHEVFSADNGHTGADLARAQLPDLLITDLAMPHAGLAMIRALRTEFPSLPILAISGSPTRLPMAEHLGASRILAKPFTIFQFEAAVHELLIPRVKPPPKI